MTVIQSCHFYLSSLLYKNLILIAVFGICNPIYGTENRIVQQNLFTFKLTTASTKCTIQTFTSPEIQHKGLAKEAVCLRAARWTGAVSGGMMGVLQIFWSVTGMSGVHGPVWKNVITGIPSSLIGGYTGAKTTEWVTYKLISDEPGIGRSIWKGVLWGAMDGAVTFTAGMIPLLVIGHYMDTIDFNMDNDWIVFKLVGAGIMGGCAYGGTFGMITGGIAGPCISIYMEF